MYKRQEEKQGFATNDVGIVFDNREGDATACLKGDGSIVTWGRGWTGGDSSSVRAQLQGDVEQVISTSRAFAALKGDKSIVTWGDAAEAAIAENSAAASLLIEAAQAAGAKADDARKSVDDALHNFDGAFVVGFTGKPGKVFIAF